MVNIIEIANKVKTAETPEQLSEALVSLPTLSVDQILDLTAQILQDKFITVQTKSFEVLKKLPTTYNEFSSVLTIVNRLPENLKISLIGATSRDSSPFVTELLLDLLKTEQVERIKFEILYSLAKRQHPVARNPFIDIALNDASSLQRQEAFAALANYKDIEVLEIVMRAASHESNALVRKAAIGALGKLGFVEATDLLLQIVTNEQEIYDLRGPAAYALGRIASDDDSRVLNVLASLIGRYIPAYDDAIMEYDEYTLSRYAALGVVYMGKAGFEILLAGLDSDNLLHFRDSVTALLVRQNVALWGAAVAKILRLLTSVTDEKREYLLENLPSIARTEYVLAIEKFRDEHLTDPTLVKELNQVLKSIAHRARYNNF